MTNHFRTEQIARAAYDGNYEIAIKSLLKYVQSLESKIDEIEEKYKCMLEKTK